MTKEELKQQLVDEGTYKLSFDLAIDTLYQIQVIIAECRKSIEKDGIMYKSTNETKKKNPAVELLSDLLREQRQTMSLLGLTPKDAKQLGKLTKEENDGFDD
jgi:P27 family predicted phage terminase small subunit